MSPWRRRLATYGVAALGGLGLALLVLAAALPSEVHESVPSLGAALVLLALLRPAWRALRNAAWGIMAFAGAFQVIIFMAIAIFLYSLVLARDAVESSFDASLRSLELSHLVVSYRDPKSKLDQRRIDDHDRELRQQVVPALAALDKSWWREAVHVPANRIGSITSAAADRLLRRLWPHIFAAEPVPERATKVPRPRYERLAFGRWLELQQSVRWPMQTEFAKTEDFEPKRACASPPDGDDPPTFTNAAVLSISPGEPAIRQMRYREGASIGTLQRLRRPPVDDTWGQPDADEVMGAIVSDRLLDILRRTGRTPESAVLGKYLCIYGPNWRLVRIVGIVEQLPKEDLVPAVHVLVPHALYEDKHNNQPGQNGPAPGYDSEAIYFADPRLVSLYKPYFQKLSGEGTILPDAFQRIQKGLETSRTLTDLVGSIVYGVIAFSTLLVGLLTFFFIRQNEKSLCVMRAFGVRLRHVIGLVTLQTLMIWAAALAATMLVGWPIAGPLRQLLIERMELSESALHLTPSVWLAQVALMTLFVVLAAAMASTAWWLRTRAVGDRLKELD